MLSASRFIYQSIKSYNCGGMLQHSCSTSAQVFVRKAPSIYISPHSRTVPTSFRKFIARFSTTLPFQWNKSRGKLFGKIASVRSCFSGSHLSKLQNNFVPGEELLNIIKSASYGPGGRPLAACLKGNKTLVNILADCEINDLSLLLKENMSEKLNGDRNQDAAIEEPYAVSSFRNLLLYHAGSLSVDEDGGRIFLSDSNHHRIIVTDHDGRILDSIGSSPGFLDAEFESAKLWRPAASFYNVSDGCLYFVDSENNAIRRADMTRRLVETMYPISKSSGIWDRISGMWSWILNYFGLAKDKTKTEEFGFDLLARPWHLLNVDDDELLIISHSFAVAWTMSMTTWKLKEVITGFHNIFESYGNLIVEKLSCLKDACVVLPQKFSTSVSSEKIPYVDLLSSVGNFHDDIITYDAVGQSLLKYNKKSMGISYIHFSNVGLLGVPYWFSCPIERVFNNGYYFRQPIEHVHNFSVLPGRCDVRVNVEIPKDAVLAAPLDENCIWRQARGSAAEVSVLEEGDNVEEKVGVAQQWFDELDNLAFTNPEFESLEFSGEVCDKSIDRSFPDTGKVHFNCAVNVSPGTSEIVFSAALYLKPNPALSFKEAASLLNPQNHENGMLERESFTLFLEKCENISDIIFTKPLHLRIKLDCGDHPTAPTSKETILTDTSLEVNVILE